MFINISVYYCHLHQKLPKLVFKLYLLTSTADVVASVTLNYQLIQNFPEFVNLIYLFKN
jgi:cytochrome bd-type quinol oxidase subunit 1